MRKALINLRNKMYNANGHRNFSKRKEFISSKGWSKSSFDNSYINIHIYIHNVSSDLFDTIINRYTQ